MLKVIAAIAAILAFGAMVLTADGVDHIITPTSLSECVLADALIVEVVDNRNQTIKFTEINHTIISFFLIAKVLVFWELRELL